MRDSNTAFGITLDHVCTSCHGGGLHWADDGTDCHACEGRGRELTMAGEALLAFAERWLQVTPDKPGGRPPHLVRKNGLIE